MLEPNIKFLQTNINEFTKFYYENTTIYIQTFLNGTWLDSVPVISDVKPQFSLCSPKDGRHIVICSTEDNIIMLCRLNQNNTWENKPLFKNLYKNYMPKFYLYFGSNSLKILYNIPSQETKIHHLMLLSYEHGSWTDPEKIDTLIPFANAPFILNPISDEQIVIYYRIGENNITSKEINFSPFSIGNPTKLVQTSAPILDLSVLTTKDSIHVLYIIKGKYTYHLVYKSKDDNNITNPVIIWEGQKAESCSIFKIKSTLWVLWLSESQAYCATSKDDGKTFSRPFRYPHSFCKNPIKSEFINTSFKSIDYEMSEIYINSENTKDIMILADELPHLFTYKDPNTTKDEPNTIIAATQNNIEIKNNHDIKENKNMKKLNNNFDNSNFMDNIDMGNMANYKNQGQIRNTNAIRHNQNFNTNQINDMNMRAFMDSNMNIEYMDKPKNTLPVSNHMYNNIPKPINNMNAFNSMNNNYTNPQMNNYNQMGNMYANSSSIDEFGGFSGFEDFPDFQMPQTNVTSNSDDLSRLRNQINQYEIRLKENNMQILELTQSLNSQSQEKSMMIARSRDINDALQKEYDSLKSSYEEIKSSLVEAQASIKIMKSENHMLKNTKKILEDEIYKLNNPDTKDIKSSEYNKTSDE